MNTFVDSIKTSNKTKTTNGMKAKVSTKNACVDLFYKAGAMRGENIIPHFTQALNEDKAIALKIAMWLRDVRGGAGERQLFRDILSYLEINDKESAKLLVKKIPEIGRWDDGIVLQTTELKQMYMGMVKDALNNQNALCAKWMPRKGAFAVELREYLNYTPKFYRKTLVNLSSTVEQQMCAQQWEDIDFDKVPSLSHIRNRNAFKRHTPTKYADYAQSLTGDNPIGKINAGAIYPHNITSRLKYEKDEVSISTLTSQWNALPNFINGSKILPIVDVSGSMNCGISGNNINSSMVTCMDVAVSLGLYVSQKQQSAFKDVVMTFSENPNLVKLSGDLAQKLNGVYSLDWEMNTNIEKTFNVLLEFATNNKVKQKDMPEYLLIMSDMQFDQCTTGNGVGVFKMIEEKFKNHGYTLPKIVFWNLHSYDNVPVKFDKLGTALVSGFSPAILQAVLSDNLDDFSPISVMMETLSNPRYEV